MSAELDLSPPEVPEPTFLESILRYGLFLGAVFQLVCILAVLLPTHKAHEQNILDEAFYLWIKRHRTKLAPQEEAESTESKAVEQVKKPKGPAPQIRQKPKKESKKKR